MKENMHGWKKALVGTFKGSVVYIFRGVRVCDDVITLFTVIFSLKFKMIYYKKYWHRFIKS